MVQFQLQINLKCAVLQMVFVMYSGLRFQVFWDVPSSK